LPCATRLPPGAGRGPGRHVDVDRVREADGPVAFEGTWWPRSGAVFTFLRYLCSEIHRTGRSAGTVVLNVRTQRPRSVVRRIRSLAQNVSTIALLAFLVLKLVGLIAWSWWWVLSPLWVSGILLAAMLCAVLAPYLWQGRRLG
jgi:hypothetical protein